MTVPVTNPLNLQENIAGETALHEQMELPFEMKSVVEPDVKAFYDLLTAQGVKLDDHHQYLKRLSKGLVEVLLSLQEISHSSEEIGAIRDEVKVLSKGFIKIHRYLEKESIGSELSALRSEQQALREAIEISHKNPSDNISILDWKRIAAIVVATMVLSSLCGVAIIKLLPNGGSHNTSPAKSMPKKQIKSKN
jgi:hypothetical protein